MNRVVMFLAAGAVLSTTVLISAQTTSSSTTPATNGAAAPTKPATPAKPVTPTKPATQTKPAWTPAKPQAKATTTSAAAPVSAATAPASVPATGTAAPASPSASQVVKPAASWQPYPTAQSAGAAPATPAASTVPVSNAAGAARSYGSSSSGDGRAPVGGLGVGSFLWPGGWTLIAYGCFRTDTRLFCDFDTTNTNNLAVNASIWSGAGGVNVVDDGGKITTRHNAFFVGTDGSQFQTAYVSPQAVRFIIEYDDVDPRYTTVSLVLTTNRIQSVPVFAIDPSQPAGVFPARSASGAQNKTVAATTATATTATAPAANGDTLDKAQQTVDKGKATKKKLTDILNSVTK